MPVHNTSERLASASARAVITVDNTERKFYYVLVGSRHALFVDTLRQQLVARAAGIVIIRDYSVRDWAGVAQVSALRTSPHAQTGW